MRQSHQRQCTAWKGWGWGGVVVPSRPRVGPPGRLQPMGLRRRLVGYVAAPDMAADQQKRETTTGYLYTFGAHYTRQTLPTQ